MAGEVLSTLLLGKQDSNIGPLFKGEKTIVLTPIDLNSYLLVAIIAVGIKVITTFLKDVSWGKRRVAIIKRVKEISVKDAASRDG